MGLASEPIEVVTRTLEEYANRGVFRGFSSGPLRSGKATFRLKWHQEKLYDFVFDANKRTLRFPLLLPNVPASSPMYTEFKRFIRSRQAETLAEHRRLDSRKGELKPYNRGGAVSLSVKVLDGDYEYCTRKLIHVVNEVFLSFLRDGPYYEYMVETFDLDPDSM